MCVPKLCPFCDSNKSCESRVPIKLVTASEAKQLPNDELELEVSLGGMCEKIEICSWVNSLFSLALLNGAGRIAIVVEPAVPVDQLKEFAAIINCRAIIKFNHDQRRPVSLKEIRIVCGDEQFAPLSEGLTRQHPLCIGCYERRC